MRKSILLALRTELLDRGPLSALPDETMKAMSRLNTWGSNALAGSSLTLPEVEVILDKELTPGGRKVADVLATVGHDQVFRGLPARVEEPVTAETALELHALLLLRLSYEAGKLRREPRERRAHPDYIIPMLREWQDDLAEREAAGEDPLEAAARAHARFLAIHPFADANGRVGRLLLNLHLLRHSWPPVHVLPGDREAYEAALEEGHAGDAAPLAALVRVLEGRSLLLLLDRLGAGEDALESVTALGREGPYCAKYLALRASQGELPAVKRTGQWWTSRRAIGLYRKEVGKC